MDTVSNLRSDHFVVTDSGEPFLTGQPHNPETEPPGSDDECRRYDNLV